MNDTSASSASSSKLKNSLIIIAFTVSGLLVGFLSAYWHGLNNQEALVKQHVQAIEQIQDLLDAKQIELDDKNQQLSFEQNRSMLIQAKSAIFRALAELDNRNFGLASEQVRQSAKQLSELDAEILSLNSEAVAATSEALASFSLAVSTDIQQQRLALLEQSARIEALIQAAHR